MKIQIGELKDKSHCGFCRKLMKQENPPEFLEIYRGEMLCLTVNVKLSAEHRLVEEDQKGLFYKKYNQEDYIKLRTYA